MATEKLNQNKKRTIQKEDQIQAKRAKKKNDTSSFADDEQVAGKITRIFMKNFMCHDAMEVNLNHRVNFIVGVNGSGKSAILTALTIGLGARAKATDRGPSIKEFIKKGKNSGMIQITISNDGPMAYKYETYGNSITIIRHINTNSSYKIKNWKGDLISTKKEELHNIVNFLNIQVDNPISVLNQDVSRSFLVTAESQDKYKLFMRATRLDIIGNNYKEAIISSENARLRLQEAQKYLNENRKEITELKKKLKALESLEDIKKEYENLQKELHWATVIQEENILLQINTRLKDEEDNIKKFENLESTKITKEQEINLKIEDLKKEIRKFENEASDSNVRLNDIKIDHLKAKKTYDEKKENIRIFHASIKRKENDIITLQNEIKKLERENSAAGDKKQEAKQKMNESEQQLDEVEAMLRTKQTDLMHLEENKRRIEQKGQKFRIEIEQKRSALYKLKQRLNAFKNQPNDEFTIYGPNMPRLLARIEEAHTRGKFKQKPLGPLGSFIKLKDSSWIPAIENYLGFGTITAFCVDNSQDGQILNRIIKEVFQTERPPQIIISKFFDHMHNVEDGCTNSPKYSNLLDAMEISHPVIANSLIDQREIECILLIPTSNEACTVMSNVIKVPQNCKRAITKNSDLFYPDPNYRIYGGSVSKAKYLQVSTNEAIQSLQEEIGIVENELKMIQNTFNDVHESMKTNQIELQEVQHKVKTLLHQQQQLKSKIEEFKEIYETCNNNTINTFIAEVEELQRQVVQKKEQESHMITEFRESKTNFETITSELKNLRDLAQNLDTKLNPIKEKIKELEYEKSRLSVSNQGATRRMKEAQQSLQKLHCEQQQQERVVNSKIEIAEKICLRVNTQKTISEINTRTKELKLTIETIEKQHGTKDVLSKKLQEKEEKYEGVHEFAIELTTSNDRQLERLRNRKLFYNEMKKQIGERVQQSFVNVLSLRNYKGQITIDHQKRELLLEVSPVNDVKRSTNDAKALSGGERSYSTVAFILALWDSTGLPFYFLDEFDVFMDKINRRMIMDILLGHAQSHPQSQFAFLTPLDTSHIVADDKITIHRLAPPERST
ncbi:PREDICTED: structural maintenance of chromosomes protein 6 [Ceratosolen solmsi marchali]|uniref:Structural maintenance of chromosomes protein 6 n=1 Tax=Ceratosolen solmsi marchali TaxID=326594 RepID=A0AAJ6YF00_9HYME|nr:PREDICTED: structural maintenance of chromosomes protein 6 [Ceratosolen solmsi marchali]